MAIHTKQMTKQIIDWLVDKDYEVEDVSYGNDLCDSLIVNGRVHIMLPNSFIDDESNELFNSFVVKKDEEQEGEVAHSVDQVLELINKNMSKFFRVSGYWKDTKTEFSDLLVKEFDDMEDDETDEFIFYYGLSEEDLKNSSEEDSLEFVITNYEEVEESN